MVEGSCEVGWKEENLEGLDVFYLRLQCLAKKKKKYCCRKAMCAVGMGDDNTGIRNFLLANFYFTPLLYINSRIGCWKHEV